MPTPLVATYRIVTQYTVSSLVHVQHSYCQPDTVDGDDTTLVPRDGGAAILWSDAADKQWANAFTYWVVADDGAVATLEHRVGSIWNPVAFHTLTGGGGGSLAAASQLTVVMRDTSFKKLRLTLMEGNTGYVGHSASGVGMPGDIDSLIYAFTTPVDDRACPGNWVKSRSNLFLLESGTVAGATLDLNDKLKRARGLE